MRRLALVLLALPLLLGADRCSIPWPQPTPTPGPTPTAEPTPEPTPTVAPPPMTCVPPCGEGPKCVQSPLEIYPPIFHCVPNPVPTPVSCPYPLPTELRMVNKAHGQGFDSNPVVVHDCAFCASIGLGSFPDGTPRCSCPLAAEGKPYRVACEQKGMGGCPRWEGRCYSDTPGDGECPVTFDHFDRDDPQTPEYEGEHPECAGGSGFFVIAHGRGTVRSCAPDPKVACGPWVAVNH